MAGAHCSSYFSFSLLNLKKHHPITLSLSSIDTPRYKLRRRNHLRQKLLKTLTKPYPTHITTPVEPRRLEIFEESIEHEVTFSQENAEIVGVGKVIKDEFGKYWVFKLGLYLIGILIFQTICAVWVFGSDEIVPKEEKDSVFEEKSKEKLNLLLNENENENEKLGIFTMEERLSEIQAMAREARESEKLKLKADEEDDGGVVRMGIEKEVHIRLLNVQNKLQSFAKMPAVPIREEDDSVGRGKIEPVMIKKKNKFRGYSGSLSDKPKGFSGTKGKSDNNLLANENENNVLESDDSSFGNNTERKQSALRRGATQEANLKRPDGSNKSRSKVDDERLKKGKSGQWWHSLPYVVGVVMGRGHDGEGGPRGLFTLKTNPYADDDDDDDDDDEGDLLSHIVAFEDRGDATNFCFILESFFEDLGDFRADIVPMSVKELREEMKSHSKKVVVVKKGKLKLYAGQPLPEVEMALRSLVE